MTFGSTPPSSPTRTMLEYNLPNSFGCSSSAADNATPLRTESAVFRMTALSAGFCSSSPRLSSACGMGIAAPSSALISRVNAVMSFRLMRWPKENPAGARHLGLRRGVGGFAVG